MATHWKKQLADAHHEVRKLKNRVHELEQLASHAQDAQRCAEIDEACAVKRLESLQRERERHEADARPFSLIEQAILALCAALETMPETPARRRLIDRLVEAILGKDGS